MKKPALFDALLDFPPPARTFSFGGAVRFQSRIYPARFVLYPGARKSGGDEYFAQISVDLPLSLRWKDHFEGIDERTGAILGRGTVLDPCSSEPKKNMLKKRLAHLRSLTGDEKEMVLALCRKNKLEGVRESELVDFCRLSLVEIDEISRALEAEGQVRILSFSPLLILAQESFLHLCEKVLKFLARFHKNNPGTEGVSLEKFQKRFDLSPKLLWLALRTLEREGRVRETGLLFALPGFEVQLTAIEEDLLKKMEEMSLKGEFQSVSQDEIQKRFHLSAAKAQKLLAFLVERKKIVQGKDGFMLHSSWLEEIICKVRALGRKELSVSDFKNMTGLSRKYAIPLLELLDEMGITRRKGPLREIL